MELNCSRCNAKCPSSARFCPQCGTPIAATNVQGKTVALSATNTAGSPSGFDAKTIARFAKRVFGTQTPGSPTSVSTTRARNQRELTFLVLDISSSMGEEFDKAVIKLMAAILACVNMVLNKCQIDPNDEVGLVTFNSHASVILPLSVLYVNKTRIIQLLQSLQPDNGTDINEGLQVARDNFDWNRSGVVRRIMLLTDGHGGNPVATAEDLKSRGVIIDVIGIGPSPAEVEEGLLKKVASVVDGQLRYRFIKDHKTLIAHYTQLANKTSTSK
jgi:Mg-chelatase subunit ChlD